MKKALRFRKGRISLLLWPRRAAGKERMVIHLVSRGDELLSGHIGSYSGNMAIYLLGATSAKGRDLRASYVAQWAVIDYARELGLGHYDLGGVDRQENPSVYRFKERMGGVLYDGPAPVQCYPGALGGLMLRGAEAAYRLVKGRGHVDFYSQFSRAWQMLARF